MKKAVIPRGTTAGATVVPPLFTAFNHSLMTASLRRNGRTRSRSRATFPTARPRSASSLPADRLYRLRSVLFPVSAGMDEVY
jgi:hypothetical protein